MAKAKYTKGKDGYFKTNVWSGEYDEHGKKKIVCLRSKISSRDLENKVREHNERIFERQFTRQSSATFQEYARTWSKAYKAHLEHNTKAMYENIIEKHFALLQCQIGAINRGIYITALNGIVGKRTQQQFQMVFKQVLKAAIHDKLLPASIIDEIMSDSVKVKYKAKEKRSLTQVEKDAIKKCQFKYAKDELFLMLLYYTGMRGEEIRALTRFDINLKKNEISVTKAVTFDGNNPIVKDTKNGTHRIIPIADPLKKVLETYLDKMNGTELFEGMTKSAYRKMWSRVLDEIQKNAGEPITDLTPHIFRHNYCSSLCRQIPNITFKKIAELLGDSEKMVIEVYNHDNEQNQKPHDIVASALAL